MHWLNSTPTSQKLNSGSRGLREPLGYTRWEIFLTAIRRAIDSCKSTGYDPDHHFRGVTKLISQLIHSYNPLIKKIYYA
jgi:hypothetical protein